MIDEAVRYFDALFPVQTAKKQAKPIPPLMEFAEKHIGYKLFDEQKRLLQWAHDRLFDGRIKMFLAMRKIGKSDLITVCLSAYIILTQPNKKLLIATKAASTRKTLMDAIRRIVLQYTAPAVINDSRIVLRHDKNKSPNLLFVLAGASLRGARADAIICDDIQDQKDKRAAEREHTLNAYTELKNICNNMLLIGQLADPECLHNRLRADASVEKLELWFADVSQELKNAVGLESIEKIQSGGIPMYDIGLNYLGRIIIDDVYYFAHIRVAQIANTSHAPVYACLDPAHGGEDSTALVLGFWEMQSGRPQLFVETYLFDNANDARTRQEILKICTASHTQRLYIENNSTNGLLIDIFRNESRNASLSIRGFRPYQKKSDRIYSTLMPIWEDIAMSQDGQGIETILQWREDAKHDDLIDALASLVKLTRPKN